MRIYTQATMMWLAVHSAEFIVSSKEQIKEDPDAFWPEEEGEAIGGNWATYPENREVFFEGDEEEAYIDTDQLAQIEILVDEASVEFKAPEQVDEALRNQIMAACNAWIEEAQSQVTTIAAEFSRGRGLAEVRTMDFDVELSMDVEAEEPVNPVKDCMVVLLSVSSSEVSFQHMLGLVFRGAFHKWEAVYGEGGSGFTTSFYDENGRRYMSFSMYGQGSEIEVY
jgi:E3 ubiquitin-protein ligase DOA10